jgi:hypothetical protein
MKVKSEIIKMKKEETEKEEVAKDMEKSRGQDEKDKNCKQIWEGEQETKRKKLNSVAFLVCKRTIPTEQPPHVGEISANFCG